MAVHLGTAPYKPPSAATIALRVVGVILLLMALGYAVRHLGGWFWEQLKLELEQPAQAVEVGFRVGGASGAGTSERSLFAAIALQGILANEGRAPSAAARQEQVEEAIRYADVLLELRLKEVAP
jgi:hypothetical protein